MMIGITRPKEYIEESAEIVRSYGFEPFFAPMISLYPVKTPDFQSFIDRLYNDGVDFIVFTSANGVKYTLKLIKSIDSYYKRLIEKSDFINRLMMAKIVAIGPKTEKALREIGISDIITPSEFSSRGITDLLRDSVQNKDIELLRSSKGNLRLKKELEDSGAIVNDINVYTAGMPQKEDRIRSEELVSITLNGRIDAITVTSRMIADNFFSIADKMGVKEDIIDLFNSGKVIAAVIGKETAKSLEMLGIKRYIMPEEFTFDAMIREIKNKIDK